MPDKVVQVDGVGNVAFPDSMKDEDIAGVIKQQHPNLGQQQPSIGQRALSNLPRSIANLAQNAFPVQNEQLPIDPAQRHVRGPMEDIGNLVSGIGSRIMHPMESFANDPAGTVAIPAMAAAGGIKALGGPEAAISKMVPQTFNPIPHIGAAIKAAAPDVIKGGMKAGVGLTLAQEAPGMLKWPARGMLGYPGLRQMYKGMRAGGSALGGGTTEEALAGLPAYNGGITNPETPKMPAVFGDPQGFSKLPQSVQDAILKGQGSIARPKATTGPLAPRSREDYLGSEASKPTAPRGISLRPEVEPIIPQTPGGAFKILTREGKEVGGFPSLDQAQKFSANTRVSGLRVQVPMDAAKEMEQTYGRDSLLGLDVEGVGHITGFNKGEGSSFPTRISSPAIAPPGTIPVPKPTVEGAVEKLNVEPHEPYESYSPSRVERQMTPAETTPARAEYEARVGRLKKAFPLESDQQIRARADRAIIDKKLGAAGLKKQDFQSMGGQ